ncbi:MAG: thioesterase domain-containing protein, partial [Thiovulaceae bacterium]|nr:thioesterase domain-containing protein [Sulfurimonadaceae bacterium]
SMGIDVLKAQSDEVVIKAPLELNINHKCTAFGGSLNTTAVLACWSMLFVRLQSTQTNAHIVIHSSSVSYIKPVSEDIIARCDIKDEAAYEKMMKMYERYGKARIKLEAEVYDHGELALTFTGEYVIHS